MASLFRKWRTILLSVGAGVLLLGSVPVARASQETQAFLTLPEGGLRLLLFSGDTPVRFITFQNRVIRLFPWGDKGGTHKGSVRAGLVGVDFARPPGPVPLFLHSEDRSGRKALLLVMARSFQVSRLHVARSFVTPPPALLRRLARERAIIHRALDPPDEPLRFHRPFILPLSGQPTHDFGAYRYLNGRAMARHSGEDIDAPQGTPVRASNDGVVRLAGRFYYDGNMVIVNHGGGLLTEYLHMSDIRVRAGEKVRRGEIIGHVGHTGRVTGPVLHYGAVLHGDHINPMLLSGLVGQALPLSFSSPGRVDR